MNSNSSKYRIQMPGDINFLSFRKTVREIWKSQALDNRGILLDFSRTRSAFSGPMLAICCEAIARRENQTDPTSFELLLPRAPDLRNLFLNSNWAHLIEPEKYSSTNHLDVRKIPAFRFNSPAEQRIVTGKVIDSFVSSMRGFSRTDLSAIDWTLSEMIDNVLLHSRSPIGGLIQVMNMNNKNRIEINICDPGLGITETLKGTAENIVTDSDALASCVRRGVTRDPNLGKGYGLYGSSCIAINSGGYFCIHSGSAYLYYPRDKKTQRRTIHQPLVSSRVPPYTGTLIMSSVDISSPDTLLSALSFEKDGYIIPDTLERHYEIPAKIKEYDDIILPIKDNVDSYGSRISAAPFRTKINNLLRISEKNLIIIDFAGVDMMSHSFADEAIGKLFGIASLRNNLNRLKWMNLNETCERIIALVIQQNREMD